MTNIICNTEEFVSDIKQMLIKGTMNDVKIILEDGEIMANKDVLSARSDYFSTMFSNNSEVQFIEGETNIINMHYCSKIVMNKIITYLFSGFTCLHDLTLIQLLQLMNIATMMMLDGLNKGAQTFTLGFIPDSGINYASLPDLIEAFMLAEEFKLKKVKDALALELYRSLKDIPNVPDVVLNHNAFQNLSFDLLEDILVEVEWGEDEHKDFKFATSLEKFQVFMYWSASNDCSEIEKRRMTNNFDLDSFTGEELLTVVRQSGLYSVEQIDKRVLQILRVQMSFIRHHDIELETKEALIQEVNNQLLTLKTRLATQIKYARRKQIELNRLKLEIKALKFSSTQANE